MDYCVDYNYFIWYWRYTQQLQRFSQIALDNGKHIAIYGWKLFPGKLVALQNTRVQTSWQKKLDIIS